MMPHLHWSALAASKMEAPRIPMMLHLQLSAMAVSKTEALRIPMMPRSHSSAMAASKMEAPVKEALHHHQLGPKSHSIQLSSVVFGSMTNKMHLERLQHPAEKQPQWRWHL